MVDAWPLGVPGMADPDGTYDRSVLPLLEIVRQARARDMEARLDLVILTSGTFGPDIAAGAHERPLPGQSLVWGLGPVVCMEHPALRVRLMDLQHPEADDTLFRPLPAKTGKTVRPCVTAAASCPALKGRTTAGTTERQAPGPSSWKAPVSTTCAGSRWSAAPRKRARWKWPLRPPASTSVTS